MLKNLFNRIILWYEEEKDRDLSPLYIIGISVNKLSYLFPLILGDSISELLQRILVLVLVLVSIADHYKRRRLKLFLLITALAISIAIIILEILGY